MNGISVDLHWGLVESQEAVFDWGAYRAMLSLIADYGFKIKVSLCFHSTDTIPLPEWLLEEGRINPDIYFTDKAGGRNTECLTLGINDLPVLRGRTAIDVYKAFMSSFRDEFRGWLGETIVECLIGLGPNCELKYPAHPTSDKRWNFPGIGEFQCYDRFMLSSLRACADQVSQSSWGTGGPHDAGSYCLWPHQTGFFHQHGNWCTPYGKFFLQWYSEMLIRHADSVVGAAREVFSSCPNLDLSVRIPGSHWWYNSASHAPELTSGFFNTVQRDGYLPVFKALSAHGVGLRLGPAEVRNQEQPQHSFCDPEKMLLQQRTAAAALKIPVSIENLHCRFDESSFARLDSVLFGLAVNQSIELPQPTGITFHSVTDQLFEPSNWKAFKSFVLRVKEKAEMQEASAPPPHDWSRSSVEARALYQGNKTSDKGRRTVLA